MSSFAKLYYHLYDKVKILRNKTNRSRH